MQKEERNDESVLNSKWLLPLFRPDFVCACVHVCGDPVLLLSTSRHCISLWIGFSFIPGQKEEREDELH